MLMGMPRPKQRTPELREHVRSAAAEVLARDGVAGFTTRRIAAQAHTSTPAVYELFGDKRGLIRAMFFDGFRLLHAQLQRTPLPSEPRAALIALLERYREFVRANPVLAEVMFSRPFTDFEPDESELDAGASVRKLIVRCVRRCIQDGTIDSDETDSAHVLMALVQGLAWAENARRLGSSQASLDRRWTLEIEATLTGLAPAS
jgi:AcrR family transcriptional regulator